MPTRLDITLDGTAPGIQEHVLSVAAFGQSLARLLQALRRIASGLEKDAMGDRYGVRGGRYTPAARSIDVEIVSVTGGSPLHLGLQVVSRPQPDANPWLFQDLADQATERFLEALEKESAGVPYNALVRNFLSSFPEGVTAQRYDYTSQSGKRRTVEIRNLDLPESPRPLPGLFEFVALVVGVGFEPGRTEVRLKGLKSPNPIAYSATSEQVEKAITYRNSYVRALAVRGGGRNRLLGLWPADQAIPIPDPEKAEEYLFEKWKELLRRLAQ